MGGVNQTEEYNIVMTILIEDVWMIDSNLLQHWIYWEFYSTYFTIYLSISTYVSIVPYQLKSKVDQRFQEDGDDDVGRGGVHQKAASERKASK